MSLFKDLFRPGTGTYRHAIASVLAANLVFVLFGLAGRLEIGAPLGLLILIGWRIYAVQKHRSPPR